MKDNLPDIPDIGFTVPLQAMPDIYKNPDAVIAYRKYYSGDKKDLLQYTNREKPYWL